MFVVFSFLVKCKATNGRNKEKEINKDTHKNTHRKFHQRKKRQQTYYISLLMSLKYSF